MGRFTTYLGSQWLSSHLRTSQAPRRANPYAAADIWPWHLGPSSLTTRQHADTHYLLEAVHQSTIRAITQLAHHVLQAD